MVLLPQEEFSSRPTRRGPSEVELCRTPCPARSYNSMPSHTDSTSASTLTPPNAFHPTFLEQLQATNEPLTAAEADLAGPWKLEAVPGHPGCVAVLRTWESLAEGDTPFAVFRHRETAALCAALLHLVGREPLFHLSEDPDPDPSGPLTGGYPVIAVFGEQGPAVCGWLVVPPGDRGGPRSVRGPGPHAAQPRRGQRGGWRRGARPGGPVSDDLRVGVGPKSGVAAALERRPPVLRSHLTWLAVPINLQGGLCPMCFESARP